MNIHLLCRNSDGVTFDKETKVFRTGWWVMSAANAQSLIGNSVFLHERQSERSYHGGRVIEVTLDPELSGRWWIAYEYEAIARGVAHPTKNSRNPVVFATNQKDFEECGI